MSEKHSQNVKWECGFTLHVKHLNIYFSLYLKAPPCLEDAFCQLKGHSIICMQTNILCLFEFSKNRQFWFFNNLKVENHQLQFFEKDKNQ
jgi:hypothetical protein